MSRIFEEEIKIFYPFYQFEPRDIHSASVDSNGEPIYAMPLADVNHIIAVLHSNTGYDAEIISDILVAINKHIVDKEYDKAYYLACDFNNIKYSYLLTLSQSSNKVMLSDYEVDHIIEGIADALKVSLGKSSFFFTSPEDLLSNNELYHDYFIINNAENRKKASEMFNISAQNKISSKISIQACVQKLCRKFALGMTMLNMTRTVLFFTQGSSLISWSYTPMKLYIFYMMIPLLERISQDLP